MAGTPVLRKVARPVTSAMYNKKELLELVDLMVQTMRAAPGVGLAAPQIGIPLRVIVMEDKAEYVARSSPERVAALQRTPFPAFAVCNPSLRAVGSDGARFFKGCLSIPGYQAMVDRYLNVECSGFAPDGAP
ncbi:hypothetical protein WJX81_005035 [Elliptochloris bilobata]|uniref:Peptide deformylase n=1 Tax=Elliptochloris bilobata TaxID=381761 RepID=A0AAW1QUN1_9CHLO